jgi:phospholipid/cholesterol/gamma-HCH transport system substrate-binding protein
MIFGKTKLELKVGIFVFAGLVLLSIFILSLSKFKTWVSGYEASFSFAFVNGVKVGAPVRFAGMDVGEVKKMHFIFSPAENKTMIRVKCWIKREVKIPRDSTIWVNTLGLLGEKYVEIMPGKDYDHCLRPHEDLLGVDPLAMHELMRVARGIIMNIDDSITKIKNKEGTIGRLLYDDTIYNELEGFVSDIRKNPWKLFWKTKEVTEKKADKK